MFVNLQLSQRFSRVERVTEIEPARQLLRAGSAGIWSRKGHSIRELGLWAPVLPCRRATRPQGRFAQAYDLDLTRGVLVDGE